VFESRTFEFVLPTSFMEIFQAWFEPTKVKFCKLLARDFLHPTDIVKALNVQRLSV